MSTTQSTAHTTKNESKGLTKADKDAAANKATTAEKAKPGPRTTPWVDLPATPALQSEPREKTVLACCLKLLRERGRDGASLAEVKESFKEINMFHHDPKALMVWASKNRGWGFHMKQDGKVVLITKAPETK